MTISAKTIKRFVKDYELPIPVTEPQYIDYYINLFDKVYDTVSKYKMFTELVNRLGDDETFFQYSANIQQEVLGKIKVTPAYEAFINDTRDLFSGYAWRSDRVPKGQVYKRENDGKRFLSIDLVKANYAALKFYSRNIYGIEKNENDLLLGTDNFNEFIAKFTNEPYFANAKKFRQVVFGNMNPKRQQKIQKYIINEILTYLLDNGLFTEAQLKDYTSDEIVFMVDNVTNEQVNAIQTLAGEMNVQVRIETYKLKLLEQETTNDNYFVKEFDNGKIDFKGIENTLMPQVYKRYFGMELVDTDLLFYAANNRLLARYCEPIKWC